jgi:hypothetical protein
MNVRTEVRSVQSEPGIFMRRTVLLGVPLLYLMLGLLRFLAGIAWQEPRPRRERAAPAALLRGP